MWQKIYDDHQDHDFVVTAVTLDNAAGSWIEAAKPTYPVLIDRYHQLADHYNMVNVPQAVWIDEGGNIVHPAENTGAYEGFRALDFETMTMPEDVTATVKQPGRLTLQRFATGPKSGDTAHVFSWDAARYHCRTLDDTIAKAHVLFRRLGLYLREAGNLVEGDALLVEVSALLHPDSWTIWRQAADKLDNGLAAGPGFWQRVSALGDRYYYPPADMAAMPTDGPPKL